MLVIDQLFDGVQGGGRDVDLVQGVEPICRVLLLDLRGHKIIDLANMDGTGRVRAETWVLLQFGLADQGKKLVQCLSL